MQPSSNPHEHSPSLTTSAFTAPPFAELGFKPGDQHVFDYWVQGFLMTVSNAPVCLSAFIRTSLKPAPLTAYKLTSVSDDIWPVPPPQRVRRWSAGKLGPRRRRRERLASTAFNLLRVIICCLNWLALGNPKAPPPEARVGASISPEQSSVMDTLLRHVRHFVSTDRLSTAGLGRNAEKFDRLAKLVRELPVLPEVDIDRFVHDLYRTLDPYSRPPSRARATQRASTEQDSPQEPVPLACSPPASAKSSSDHVRLVGERLPVDVQACKPVVASRIKWKYAPTFDPTPFLKDPLARAAFEDPNALRLPPSEWPRVPKARVHATRDELIKLARVWDSVGALRIFRQDEISDLTECVGLFLCS